MHQQLVRILQAITDTREALHQDIATVSVGLGLLRAEHSKLMDRVKQAETSLATMEPEQRSLTEQMGGFSQRLLAL